MRHYIRAGLVAAVCMAAVASWSSPTSAKGRRGERAPWFKLEDIKGNSFSRARLRGRPAVLVVGRTQEAAPPCKKWVLEIIKRQGKRLPVYQVIVVDKDWFIPRSLVISKVKDFTPRNLRHRVLLEWYTVFADAYGVSKHDDPVVFVLGPDGTIRWRHRGRLTRAALAELDRALQTGVAQR
jgi:peroxiredoxin